MFYGYNKNDFEVISKNCGIITNEKKVISMDKIIVKGARENNLKNVDIELPKNKLIVMTRVL